MGKRRDHQGEAGRDAPRHVPVLGHAVKAAPRSDARRAALIGIPAGLATGVTVFALADHFAHARDWISIPAVPGGFVLLMLASDLAGPRGNRLRSALGTLAAVTIALAALGGLYWVIGRHWGEAATYTAGVAYEALLAGAWRMVYLARRRLYWNRYGYSQQARRAQAQAEALWPRRGARR